MPHQDITLFSVNGLYEIASKVVLDQEKWTHFQQETFFPFFVIFHNQTFPVARRRVVECLSSLAGDDPPVESGWSVLLDLFEDAARDDDDWIVAKTYQILDSNFVTIPSKFGEKLLCVLFVYATQSLKIEIQEPAMASAMSIAMQIELIPSSVPTMVSAVLTTSENENVIRFASELLFRLIPKLSLDWGLIENELILPLFATSDVFLQVSLVKDLFHTLFPAVGEKILSFLRRLSDMLVALNDSSVVAVVTRELCRLFEHQNEKCQEVAVQLLLAIIRAGPTLAILEMAIDGVHVYSVLSVAVETAVKLESMDLVIKGLPLVIETGIEKEKTRTAEIVIRVLDFANAAGQQGIRIVELVYQMLERFGTAFLVEKRREFQIGLFAFYLNDARDARRVVREIALKTQELFNV
jgi:hypothetical protein